MIDTHCHIDLYEQPLELVQESESQRIETIAVTYLPSHFLLAKQHLSDSQFVRPALGLHPLAAKEHAKELPLFLKYASETDLIGEIGLDFSPAAKSTKPIQEQSFSTIAHALSSRRRFITVHSRAAEDSVIEVLKHFHITQAVFHWFTGSRRQLCDLLDQGHGISLNTAMIATAKCRELISFAPRTSILTESDGPFVHVGKRPARPSDIRTVLDWLAIQWKVSAEQVTEQISSNYRRFLPS